MTCDGKPDLVRGAFLLLLLLLLLMGEHQCDAVRVCVSFLTAFKLVLLLNFWIGDRFEGGEWKFWRTRKIKSEGKGIKMRSRPIPQHTFSLHPWSRSIKNQSVAGNEINLNQETLGYMQVNLQKNTFSWCLQVNLSLWLEDSKALKPPHPPS